MPNAITARTNTVGYARIMRHYRLACEDMGHTRREGETRSFVDCLVPWDLANLYLQAAAAIWGIHLSCERVGDRAHLTGAI